jgi:hypothetical protein
MNLFKSVVASAISSGVPNFPYTFGDRQDSEGGIWVLQNGQRRVMTTPPAFLVLPLLIVCSRMTGLIAVYSLSILMRISHVYRWHEMPLRNYELCGIPV